MKYLVFVFLIILMGCVHNDGSLNTYYVAPTNGYAQMVVVESESQKTLFISGQVGEGENLRSQMIDVLDKLKSLLEREGADYQDLVKINTYIVDYESDDLDVFRNVRRDVFGDEITPASTLIGVQSLALPEWMIEIDAVAVVGNN